MTKPITIIVGADKGGVGKTTVSRALIDYLDARGIANRSFDTESDVKEGVLKRFYPDRAEIVDLTDSDGQMRVFDSLGANVTVIDCRAALLTPTLKLLGDVGLLDQARYTNIVLHVLGNNQASIDEVAPVAEALAGVRHVLVGNRISNTKFTFPPGSIDIPMLGAAAAEAVDKSNMPFSKFASTYPSAVLSGTVGHWLGRVFAQFDAAKLP